MSSASSGTGRAVSELFRYAALDPRLLQRRHLILHQGNQRRNHHRAIPSNISAGT